MLQVGGKRPAGCAYSRPQKVRRLVAGVHLLPALEMVNHAGVPPTAQVYAIGPGSEVRRVVASLNAARLRPGPEAAPLPASGAAAAPLAPAAPPARCVAAATDWSEFLEEEQVRPRGWLPACLLWLCRGL